MITAACYQHEPILGAQASRMVELENSLSVVIAEAAGNHLRAWVVLPNHYHVLVFAPDILGLLKSLGRMHGRLSRRWNLEDRTVGRKVWHGAVETMVKSDRHHCAVLNYIYHNPVKHGMWIAGRIGPLAVHVTIWNPWAMRKRSVVGKNIRSIVLVKAGTTRSYDGIERPEGRTPTFRMRGG